MYTSNASQAACDEGLTEGKAQAGREAIREGSGEGLADPRTRIPAAMSGSEQQNREEICAQQAPALMLGTVREREWPLSPPSIP